MAIILKSSAALAVANGIKALIYANAGTGKTMLSATAPKPVVISAESGLLSLSKGNIERVFGIGTPGINYDMPVIEINNLDDLIAAELWCHTAAAAQFDTVILDSITEIAEKVLSNAKGQVKDPRQAYGELIEKMTTVVKQFRDLQGKNVIMFAKEERQKDEQLNAMMFMPSMPGSKLGGQLPYLFDEVFHLGIGKEPDGSTYRYLRTQPDFTHTAKDRSGALNELEIPNLTTIITKIQNAAQSQAVAAPQPVSAPSNVEVALPPTN